MPRRTRSPHGTPCWVDCITPDLSGSRAFYSALLDWEFVTESPGYDLAVLRGRAVCGFGAAPAGLPPHAAWNIYLATDDADLTCERVWHQGGRVVMPPVPAGGGSRLFLAIDAVGATVGFWEGERAVGGMLVDEPGALCGHELRTQAAGCAEAFYGELFGGGGGGVPVVESDQGRPQWLPRFGATDPEAATRRAVALGAQVLRPAREEPAVLRDPWGAEFGLTAAPAAG